MKGLKVGCSFLIIGIVMFFIGSSIFTYQGKSFYGMNTIGEISFVLWLPMIIFGVINIISNLIKIDKEEQER